MAEVAKTKVLVVDDDAQLLQILESLLPDKGIEIDKAFDGPSALGKLEKGQYDVILLDLRMPNMDGREFLKEYQSRQGKTPIVIMTAGDDELLQPFKDLSSTFRVLMHKPRSLQPFIDAIAYAKQEGDVEPKLIVELDVPPVVPLNLMTNELCDDEEDSDRRGPLVANHK